MWFLVSAIIFGSLFSIVFKVCQSLRIDTDQVIHFNYLTAFIIAVLSALLQSGGPDSVLQGFSPRWSNTIPALVEGILFVLSFVVMDHSVWRSGVALTTVAARASLILPVIFSWIFLAQPAPAWLPVGIVLISLALIILPAEGQKHDPSLLTNKTDAQRRRRTLLMLVSVFACYGCSDFGLKIVQQTDPHTDVMMGLIFISATLFSLLICFVKGSFRKHPLGIKSILGGFILGLVNTLCTASLLRALGAMSTGLFYPLYNIGIVLVATLTGIIFFKERLKPVQFAGIALSILAIVLFFR